MNGLDYQQILQSFFYGLHYVPVTLELMFVPLIICSIFGFLIALIRIWNISFFAKFFQFTLMIIKGLPVYLVLIFSNLMFILYFNDFAKKFGLSIRVKDVNTLYLAIALLAFSFLPSVSELFRGGLLSVSQGQVEAAYAAGLTKFQALRRIVVPQMIPEIIPGLTNIMAALLKASALAFSLGVMDIMNAAIRVASGAYNMLEGYIAAAIIYWGLNIIIEWFMGRLFKRVTRYQYKINY